MSERCWQSCDGGEPLCLSPVRLPAIVMCPFALPFCTDKLFGKRLLQAGRYIMSHKSWMKTVPTENCDVLMTLPGACGGMGGWGGLEWNPNGYGDMPAFIYSSQTFIPLFPQL